MAITKDVSRQTSLFASVTFDYADIPTTATVYEAIDLPPNAMVVGGKLYVTTAWNSGTTATVDIGDTTDPDRYSATPCDLTATAPVAYAFDASPGGHSSLVGGLSVDLTTVFAGTAATAGEATLVVEYIIAGRANEVN